MLRNKAALLKGVLLIVGLGLGAVFLRLAMDQARQTSCNSNSADKAQCLTPLVSSFALTSDGAERKVDGPGSKTSP